MTTQQETPSTMRKKVEAMEAKTEATELRVSALEKSLSEIDSKLKLSQTAKTGINSGTQHSDKSEKPHSRESPQPCVLCKTFAIKGREAGQTEVLRVPGVAEAITYYQEMQKLGLSEGWHQAPGALSAVQLHQVMMQPVDALLEE